jgi:acetolactate synthase I/III small subunit
MNQPASAYFLEERHDPNETHTLSVLVQNEPGVLARVIGLFSGRGYNIESLTVSETESQKHLSRITIVTTGTPMVIEQIKHQLDRMVPVYRVVDMTITGRSIERELAMVKVCGRGDSRVEALRLADAFRARVIDATTESFVFEITGNSSKINQFIDLMRSGAGLRGCEACWRGTGITIKGGSSGSIPRSPRSTTGMTIATSAPARR